MSERSLGPNLVNPTYRQVVYPAVTAVGLSALAMFCPLEAVKIVGLTVLTGAGYGFAHHMIACRDCIEYFTFKSDSFWQERIYDAEREYRPILTLNPNLNAIVWGFITTWRKSAIAGVVLALIARCPMIDLALKITARQLVPYLLGIAIIFFIISHIVSRIAQNRMQKHIDEFIKSNPGKKDNANAFDFDYLSEIYDVDIYYGVPVKFKAGWHSCKVRDSAASLGLGIGSLILSISMIAARIFFSRRMKCFL